MAAIWNKYANTAARKHGKPGRELRPNSVTIDAHTHMELPFGGTFAKDTFESGSKAAAHGGTTTIVDFAVQSKGNALREGLDVWMAKAEGKFIFRGAPAAGEGAHCRDLRSTPPGAR